MAMHRLCSQHPKTTRSGSNVLRRTIIQIPNNIEDATVALEGLGKILMTGEWERAAIVYAFTEISDDQSHVSNDMMSPLEFAELGIPGLKSKTTVRRYHEAWQTAIDSNDAAVTIPGHGYIMPTIPWPPMERTPRQSGATLPRIIDAMKDRSFMDEVIANLPFIDLDYLLNKAQARLNSNKTPKEPKEQGSLDVMVAAVDMADALDSLEDAEPSWSAAVREGHITEEVAGEHLARLSIASTLMSDASVSDSFEASVPR